MTDEIRVRDEDARGVIVRLEDSNGLSGLHEQSFVALEFLQCLDDRAVGFPTTRSAASSAINDEVFGALGDVLVQVVHEHAHGSFLLPSFAGDLVAAGSTNRSGSLN